MKYPNTYVCVAIVVFLVLAVWLRFFSMVSVQLPDGSIYKVRRGGDVQAKARALARLKSDIEKVIAYIQQTDSIRASRLREKYRGVLQEIPYMTSSVAYSENKGSTMAFCIEGDYHTLLFVALHELSHVLNKTYGHGKDFWAEFRYVLAAAESAGVYRRQNGSKMYCGTRVYFNV